MRSSRGFLAALVFLLGLPTALLSQVLFGAEVETMIHFLFGVGFALMSFSVFDFRTPRWTNWVGCISAAALAAIFLLQGLSELIHNDSLTFFAFQVLGQRLERWLPDILIFWFVAMLLVDSEGRTRILGFVAMLMVVGGELYSYVSSSLGDPPAEGLKLLFLLPFVWFLFESRKKALPVLKGSRLREGGGKA